MAFVDVATFAMAGKHRIPDIVRIVDRLSRGRAGGTTVMFGRRQRTAMPSAPYRQAKRPPVAHRADRRHRNAVRVDVAREQRTAINASTCNYLDGS
jgi:hypothetical protein